MLTWEWWQILIAALAWLPWEKPLLNFIPPPDRTSTPPAIERTIEPELP